MIDLTPDGLVERGRWKGTAASVAAEIATIYPALTDPHMPWPVTAEPLYNPRFRAPNAKPMADPAHCLACYRVFDRGRDRRHGPVQRYCGTGCKAYMADASRWDNPTQPRQWTTCAVCGVEYWDLAPHKTGGRGSGRGVCPAPWTPGGPSWWVGKSACAMAPTQAQREAGRRRALRRAAEAARGGDKRRIELMAERARFAKVGLWIECWLAAESDADRAAVATNNGVTPEIATQRAETWHASETHLRECRLAGKCTDMPAPHRHRQIVHLATRGDGSLARWIQVQADSAARASEVQTTKTLTDLIAADAAYKVAEAAYERVILTVPIDPAAARAAELALIAAEEQRSAARQEEIRWSSKPGA